MDAPSNEGKPLQDDATLPGDSESETKDAGSETAPMQVDDMPSTSEVPKTKLDKNAYVDKQKSRPPLEDQDPERERVRNVLLRPEMKEKDPRRSQVTIVYNSDDEMTIESEYPSAGRTEELKAIYLHLERTKLSEPASSEDEDNARFPIMDSIAK